MGRRLERGVLENGPDWSRLVLRFQQEREAKGWSINQLALEAGVSRAHLSRIENQQRQLTTDLAYALSNALGLKISELIPEAPPLPQGSPPAPLIPLAEAAEQMIELPLWGAVGCGQGLELAHPELELVPARLAKGSDGWVWARGNSMALAGIENGSQVYVRKAKRGEPKDGQVVLAHTPGGAVVKRFRTDGRMGFLMSETDDKPSPPPIAVGEGVEIQGVVLRVQRPMLEF